MPEKDSELHKKTDIFINDLISIEFEMMMKLTNQDSEGRTAEQNSDQQRLKGPKRFRRTKEPVGSAYDQKLFMLGLQQAIKRNYDFEMDINVDDLGEFGDVVFYNEYVDYKYGLYFQPKPKIGGKKISYDSLMADRDDFALYQYFISFTKYSDVLTKSDIVCEYCIVYTNIDFDCPEPDSEGLRTFRRNEKDYLVFQKLYVNECKPLDLFSVISPDSENKNTGFYQISIRNEDEKERVVNYLKTRFQEISNRENDETNKLPFKDALDDNKFRSELERYLGTLVLCVNQPNEKALDDFIKSSMDFSIKDEVDFVFEYALEQIGEWKVFQTGRTRMKEDIFEEGRRKYLSNPELWNSLVSKNQLTKFSDIQFQPRTEQHEFLHSGKKLWLIASKTPWLTTLAIYQALKLSQEQNITSKKHFFLTLTDSLAEDKKFFLNFEKMNNALVFITCLKQMKEIVAKEAESSIVSAIECGSDSENCSSQFIVIAPTNNTLMWRLLMELTSDVYIREFKTDFRDLLPEALEDIFEAEKIILQGNSELVSMKQLLGMENRSRIPNGTLEELDLDALDLETLLKEPFVRIGNESPHVSDLRSMHYKAYSTSQDEQLLESIKSNPKDIFAFVGEETEVQKLLASDQTKSMWRFRYDDKEVTLKKRFVIMDVNYEEQFKRLCRLADETVVQNRSSIHLVKKSFKGWVWIETYNRNLYIERHFQPIMIDNKKLAEILTVEDSQDFVVFSGLQPSRSQIKKYGHAGWLKKLINWFEIKYNVEELNFNRHTSIDDKFDGLTNERHCMYRSVHLIKVKQLTLGDKCLHWCRSRGELTRLLETQVHEKKIHLHEVEHCRRETDFLDCEERVVLLADEPGSGKSSTLTRMAEIKSKKHWVIKIDLNTLSRLQRTLVSKSPLTKMEVCSFLLNTSENKRLSQKILAYQLERPGQVVLMFDEFDGVNPEAKGNILTLLKFLELKTSAKICVATRLQDRKLLMDHFSVFAHSLLPLEEAKQTDLLSRFWETDTKLKGKVPKLSALEVCARVLRAYYSKFFSNTVSGVLVLAEVLQNTNDTCFQTTSFTHQFLNQSAGIEDIYRMFIDRQYDIYLLGKVTSLDQESIAAIKEAYHKDHQRLAMQNQLGYEEAKTLLMDDMERKFSVNVLSQIGLIQGNSEPVKFTQPKFEPCFVAEWLAENIGKPQVKEFVRDQLFRSKYNEVDRIFNSFLVKDLSDAQGALLTKCKEDVFIQKADVDRLDRTVFHLAAQMDRIELFMHFQGDENILMMRDYFNRTPMHYASLYGSERVVVWLLNKYVDIDLSDHIFKKPLHFDTEIGTSIFNDLRCKRSNFIKMINKQDVVLKSPLYYAAVNKHWTVACRLLLHGANTLSLTKEHKKDIFSFAATNKSKTNPMNFSFCGFSYFGIEESNLFPIVGLLCIQVPEAMMEIAANKKCCSLLSSFYQKGHTKVIDSLLKSVEDAKRRKEIANWTGEDNVKLFKNVIEDKETLCDTDYSKVLYYLYRQVLESGMAIDDDDFNELLTDVASRGYLETFKFLYGKLDDEFSPSIMEDNIENIKLFLSNIPNMNLADDWLQCFLEACCVNIGITKLHIIALKKNIDSIENLNAFFDPDFSHHHSIINVKDKCGYSPLGYAAMSGNFQFIRNFFEALKKYCLSNDELYETITSKNLENQTPLHNIVLNQDFKSASVWLSAMNTMDFRNEQLFNILNSRDNEQMNPLDLIQSTKIANLLFEYIKSCKFSSREYALILMGNKMGNLLHRQIGKSQDVMLATLDAIDDLALDDIDRLAIINASDEHGDTPLHKASRFLSTIIDINYFEKTIKVIYRLLHRGSYFNACNAEGETPLDILANRKNLPHLAHWRTDSPCSLLNFATELFELVQNNQLINSVLTLNKMELNCELFSKFIFNIRNADGKTLLQLSNNEAINLFLQWFTKQSNE